MHVFTAYNLRGEVGSLFSTKLMLNTVLDGATKDLAPLFQSTLSTSPVIASTVALRLVVPAFSCQTCIARFKTMRSA